MSTASLIALCQAMPLPSEGGASAPEWIHLLPAGTITTADGRGPYRVPNAADLVRVSLQAMNGGAVVDENHATDLAAPKGEPAPARGWIKDLEARSDGIWGKVDWTPAGAQLMADKAYRHISPVISHRGDGTVTAILRASLINKPNLRGLTALHQEMTMDFMQKLRAALGLPETADEAAIVTAVGSTKTALQGALDPIAKAAGLAEGADAAAVLAGVEQLKTTGGANATVVALQAELTQVTTRFNALETKTKTDAATAFVDAAIKAGRVGVKPLREDYIAMHMANPAQAEKMINAQPPLGPSGARIDPPVGADGKADLTPEQRQVVALMGVDPEAYKKTLADQAKGETSL